MTEPEPPTPYPAPRTTPAARCRRIQPAVEDAEGRSVVSLFSDTAGTRVERQASEAGGRAVFGALLTDLWWSWAARAEILRIGQPPHIRQPLTPPSRLGCRATTASTFGLPTWAACINADGGRPVKMSSSSTAPAADTTLAILRFATRPRAVLIPRRSSKSMSLQVRWLENETTYGSLEVQTALSRQSRSDRATVLPTAAATTTSPSRGPAIQAGRISLSLSGSGRVHLPKAAGRGRARSALSRRLRTLSVEHRLQRLASGRWVMCVDPRQ